MSADDPARLAAHQERAGYGFPLLVDSDGAVFRSYGVFNDDDPKQRNLPHPTVAVIDAKGNVRWLHTDPNYRERPPVSAILAAVAAIGDE